MPPPGAALLQYLLMPDCRNLSIILTMQGLQREFRVALAEGEVNKLDLRDARIPAEPDAAISAERAAALCDSHCATWLKRYEAAGVKTLIISLDGVLRYLPMGALHDGRRYLIEQFALARETQAVSAQTLKSPGRRAAGLGVSRAA